MISIVDHPIDYAALTESVRSTQAGAVLLFLGTVREMTGGLRTVALDYDGYRPMAARQLQTVHDEAMRRWPLTGIAVTHRLGHLELGEISVAVAVSSAHRDTAFLAGRFIIDELKRTVPIWKKENWSDGTTEWVHPSQDAQQ